MIRLTWQDFELCRRVLASRLLVVAPDAPGVYGVPRGGLPLAVALSHDLEIPLLTRPRLGCVVVDDIYDSGQTLQPYLDAGAYRVATWVSRPSAPGPLIWHQQLTGWIVFPWETAANAQQDQRAYHASRQ